jgi:hypothetical protein
MQLNKDLVQMIDSRLIVDDSKLSLDLAATVVLHLLNSLCQKVLCTHMQVNKLQVATGPNHSCPRTSHRPFLVLVEILLCD